MSEPQRRPLFCPTCGERFPAEDKPPVIGENSFVVMVDAEADDRELYDCYCPRCGWTGDIAPDLLLPEEET